MLHLRSLEHADGQRQSYHSTASRTIGDLASRRVPGQLHPQKRAETVARRMFSLYESLESPAADIGRESRTIVFNHQFADP